MIDNVDPLDRAIETPVAGGRGAASASPNGRAGAQSVGRALQLLQLVARRAPVGLSRLVVDTGLTKPTVRRLLKALIAEGFVVQDAATHQYAPGSAAYLLGRRAAPRFAVDELACDELRKGFLKLRRTVQGLSTVCVSRKEGDYPIRTHVLNVGDRYPLGLGAAAIAILGALPEEEAAAILEVNAAPIAEVRPGLDIDRLGELVAEARTRGWGVNPGLVFPGSWAIARAVRGPDGIVLGAITIAAIEERLAPGRQIDLATPLNRETDRLEALLRRFGPAVAGVPAGRQARRTST